MKLKTRNRTLNLGMAIVLVLVIFSSACSATPPTQLQPGTPAAGPRPGASGGALLNGAGATFPFPLYSKWFDSYDRLTGIKINYQSIGSGGGIKQITERTVDFGASDAPMTDAHLAAVNGTILHIPTVLGAVVVIYNLPGVPTGLKLTPEALSGIFLGEVTRWDDPRIASVNPDLSLPDKGIAVVHRTDGSGTTNIFTDYLSTVSPEWKSRVGQSTAVRWPVGIGGKGNEGVAGQVKQIPASIGYTELSYAAQNKLTYAYVQNMAGKFIEPRLEATTAAAADVQIPDDLRFSMVNPTGEQSYPIGGATWILIYQDQPDLVKGQAMAGFLIWALGDGQSIAADLLYAPLPPNLLARTLAKVKSMTYQGQPIVARGQ